MRLEESRFNYFPSFVSCKLISFFTFIFITNLTKADFEPKAAPENFWGACINASAFSEQSLPINLKSRVTDYVFELLETGILKDSDVETFILNLRAGKIISPFETAGNLSLNQVPHAKALKVLLSYQPIDSILLGEGIEKEFELFHLAKSQMKKSIKENTSFALEPKFIRIPKGTIKRVGRGSRESSITLTHDFEILNFPVTQKLWMSQMGYNPSLFLLDTPPDSDDFRIEERTMKTPPRENAPVENVAWYSAAKFTNRMSIAAGLPPTYDFEDGEYPIEKSLDRSLDIVGHLVGAVLDGDAMLEQIPNTASTNPQGRSLFMQSEIDAHLSARSIYEAKGYRLPTRAELEYILALAAQRLGATLHEDYDSTLVKFIKNTSLGYSKDHTSDFSTLRPFYTPNGIIYDLLGNVGLWTHDRMGFHPLETEFAPNIIDGIDPPGDPEGRDLQCLDFNYNGILKEGRYFTTINRDYPDRRPNHGFIVVRSL